MRGHWAILGIASAGFAAWTLDKKADAEELDVMAGALCEAPIADASGDPLPGIGADLRQRFENGRTLFSTVLQSTDGVGYAFSGVPGCLFCHSTPAIGGSSGVTQVRFGHLFADGSFDPLLAEGGPTQQFVGQVGPNAAPDCPAVSPIPFETIPADANVTVSRHAPPLFGLGLVEGIPDFALELIAQAQRFNPDGVRGRVNHVTDALTGKPSAGRFGLKAQIRTLTEFVSDAMHNELGVTSPLFPHENCPNGDCTFADCDGVPDPDMGDDKVQMFVDFIRLLSPPPPRPLTASAQRGKFIFHQIGCATCHLPDQITGPSSIPALNRVLFNPYSDFLIHDMGPSVLGSADETTQGQARAQFVRTTPLWGANSNAELFHDGRGVTVAGSVFYHGGEADPARSRFMALSAGDQTAVSDFVFSL
jgi:Di-haem oxidoreductase, putative peroxidase